jgi:hypothetical protein
VYDRWVIARSSRDRWSRSTPQRVQFSTRSTLCLRAVLVAQSGVHQPSIQRRKPSISLPATKVHASDLSLVGSWQVPTSQQVKDGDFGSTPTLFTATINGTVHQMTGLINKNGVYYAFDRTNISAGPLWEDQLAAPISMRGTGNNISSSAWDGSTLYAAAAVTTINGTNCSGSIRAINPADGSYLWQVCLSHNVLDPVTAVPGLVELGSGMNMFIFDAKTGNQLFSFQDTNKKSASMVRAVFLMASSIRGTGMGFSMPSGHEIAPAIV